LPQTCSIKLQGYHVSFCGHVAHGFWISQNQVVPGVIKICQFLIIILLGYCTSFL